MAQEGRKGTKVRLGKASELYLCVYTCGKHEAGTSKERSSPEETVLRVLKLYRNFDQSGEPHEIYDLSCVLNGGDSVPTVINGVKDCISIAELNPLLPAAQIAKRPPFFYGDSAHFVPNAKIISDSINAIMLAKRIAKEDGHRGENTDVPLSTEEEYRSVPEHENKTVIVDASGRNEAFVYELCHLDGTPITAAEEKLLINEAKACGIELRDKEFICFLAESGVAFKFAHCQSSALQYTLYLICDTGELLMAALLLESNLSHGRYAAVGQVLEKLASGRAHPSNLAAKDLLERLSWAENHVKEVLVHRFKNILLGFLRGAEVSTQWDGRDSVVAGLVAVNDKRECYCIDLLSRNSMSDYFFKYMIFESGLLSSELFESAEEQPARSTSAEGDAPSLCLQFKVSVLI